MIIVLFLFHIVLKLKTTTLLQLKINLKKIYQVNAIIIAVV